MNHKSILFFLGVYSIFVSFFSFLNILYSIYFNFILDLNSYVITLITSLLIGSYFCFIGRKHHTNITISGQIVFILLSFVLIPLLISIPYYLSIYNISFLNSYFESVSGITSTGFSIIENINNIDEPLLLWRSSSQWLGGLFFLVAVIGTIGSKQIKIKPAYLLPGGVLGRNLYNNFNYNFIRILLIYFFSTVFIIFLYSLSNIRLFDAFNLAFTVISSGGFVNSSNLNNILSNDFQIFILSITLLIPILNFFLFYNFFIRRFEIKNHYEDVHLLGIVILLSLFLYFFIISNDGFAKVFLAVTSSIATSGLAMESFYHNTDLLFILLTLIGGSLVSTTSGFKYVRFYILFKISYQEIYRLVKPINIYNKNLFNSESKISFDDAKIVFLVFITFIISIFVLSSILTFENLSFQNAFKLSILTLTNTVPSSLHGMNDVVFTDKNIFTKILLITFMILGRIEIIAVLFSIKKFILKS